jgi:hypothetical protein
MQFNVCLLLAAGLQLGRVAFQLAPKLGLAVITSRIAALSSWASARPAL